MPDDYRRHPFPHAHGRPSLRHPANRLAEDNKGPKKKQTVTAIRDKSFSENLELARNWVADYAYKYKQVLTSRLHANLPARSVGAHVEFEPKNKSDSRFGGLIGINESAFDAIRDGILDKLSVLLPLIASGASEDEIYSKWAEITADDMAFADEFLADAELPVADGQTIAGVVDGSELPIPDPQITDIVMTVDKGEEQMIPKAVETIDAHASASYRVWLPSDVLSQTEIDELRAKVSHGSIELLPAVSVAGVVNRSDLQQALLPVLFPTTTGSLSCRLRPRCHQTSQFSPLSTSEMRCSQRNMTSGRIGQAV